MKKLILCFYLFFVWFYKGYCQYEGASWPLTHNGLMLKIIPGQFQAYPLFTQVHGFIANASISDSQGNLLFFSMGIDARDKNGNLMDGGCCLCESFDRPQNCDPGQSGNPHFQGTLILPRPGHSNQYYLFIKDMDSIFNGQPLRVTASLIDMSYNNGLGKVLERAVPILKDVLSDSRMAACKHANGRDWWLINHQYKTNKIYVQLITPDSIYGPQSQNIGGAGLEPESDGWSLFSQDGSVFASVTGGMGAFGDGITVLDFDRCNGLFSNYRAIKPDTADLTYFDLAFSPNGRFLYATNSRRITQYDLQSSNITQSGIYLVFDTAAYPLLGSSVLMPDNKIYCSGWTVAGECLSVIDSPDLRAPDCSFHLRSVCIPGSLLIYNVPSFANYNLGALAGSGCDTLQTDIVGQALNTREITVFPNPANELVYILTSLETDETGIVELYNITGIKMKEIRIEGGTTTNFLTINDLVSGVYGYKLKTDKMFDARGKLVIMK